ncbi:MAG: hypothetical protein V7K27_05235 [Nostoc sp.]|uniref:hypothetical protein n=1 Tax=Nostoc sp. TaxID=1180 RepID=UPI002FFB0053
MKIDISLAGFLLSFIVAASGWFFRWKDKQKFEKQQSGLERQQAIQEATSAAEKAVNEERDFNHLRNNQIQISQGIATGFNEVEGKLDHLREQMIEIKAYLIKNQGAIHGE